MSVPTERYTDLWLISENGSNSEPVSCSVGLDAIKVLTSSGLHALLSFTLTEARCELRGSLLTITPNAGGKEVVLQVSFNFLITSSIDII